MQTIKELRVARGWTQLQLAVEVGVTPTAVWAWETGKSEPKVSQLRKLAEIFGVRMDDIVLVEPKEKKAAA